MLVVILCFLLTISTSLSFDFELEGAVHFGKGLLKRLTNDLKDESVSEFQVSSQPSSKPLPVQLMSADSYNEAIKRSDGNKLDVNNNDLPEIHAKTTHIHDNFVNGNQSVIEKLINKDNSKKVYDDTVNFKLKHKLSKNGIRVLKILGYMFKNEFNPYVSVQPLLKNATDGYIAQIDAYFEFIGRKNVTYEIDKQFAVLDMIESTNQILMNEAKKLLNTIIDFTNATKASVNMPTYMEKLKGTILAEKKTQLRYVCRIMDICRDFPGYSDHIAVLISGLLQLSDEKFKVVLKNIIDAFAEKQDFLKTIIRENVFSKLKKKMEYTMNNLSFMREMFSIARAVITQRYKMFKSGNTNIKIKTKAVRMLLDLIDKAFEVNDDEINTLEIDNTINSYKQWVLGNRRDVNLITRKFIFNAVEILRHNWDSTAKEEVIVLIDIIVIGSTENVHVFGYLFTKGSLFMRGEGLHPDPS